MNKFFKDLKAGLKDAIAHEFSYTNLSSLKDITDLKATKDKKGKLDLRSELIEIPEPPDEYKPNQIQKIRKTNRYSQTVFAKILNVSIKTVQSWESGQRTPSHAALRLLEIIDKGIYKPDLRPRK